MRQPFPEPADSVEPLDVYRDLPVVEGHPAVRLNMIASVDGATAVDGRSGGLGGPADRRVFVALRSLADVVLVAAGTVRAERYGPRDAADPRRLGIAAPRLRSAVLHNRHPPPDRRHLGPGPGRGPHADDRRPRAGDVEVDLVRAVEMLGERGFAHVLAEGGPSLDSLDETFRSAAAQPPATKMRPKAAVALFPNADQGPGKGP